MGRFQGYCSCILSSRGYSHVRPGGWAPQVRALQGGLSSRAIMGETGAMNLVGGLRTLDLDASLLPLYRAMADYADDASKL